MASSARIGRRGGDGVPVVSGLGGECERFHADAGHECAGIHVSRGAASAIDGFGGAGARAPSGTSTHGVKQGGNAAAAGGDEGDAQADGAAFIRNWNAADGSVAALVAAREPAPTKRGADKPRQAKAEASAP